MVSPNSGVQIARFYHCIRYCMVYGIDDVKSRQRIRISSVWTCYTVVLNGRESIFLECMNSPDGEYRSVLYGVVKIQKLVGES